jgi:hypothetical protein
MESERRIGEHVLRIEEDGVLVVVLRGALTADEMREIVRAHDEKLLAEGDLQVLSDLRAVTTVEPGARHALGGRPKDLPGYCTAYMVPNFKIKLVMDLLLRAANSIMKSKLVHRFFDDEAEALAWLRQMRASRRGGSPRAA